MSGRTQLPRLLPKALAGIALAALAAPSALVAQGTPTSIMVRVTSHDAKIIGSGVGGARVVIRNAESGEILARGTQEGGTGNTKSIMVDPRPRGETVYATEGAAGFLATLNLQQPTTIEIEVEGPLGTPQSTLRATKTMLVLPGKHVLGEGVVIELWGLTVDLQSPLPGASLVSGQPFTVRVKVTMLCGCPTEPGGLWDADDLEIVAIVQHEGQTLAERALAFAGERSAYESDLTVDVSGPVRLIVVASNPGTGNAGMASLDLQASPAPEIGALPTRP